MKLKFDVWNPRKIEFLKGNKRVSTLPTQSSRVMRFRPSQKCLNGSEFSGDLFQSRRILTLSQEVEIQENPLRIMGFCYSSIKSNHIRS